MNRNEGQPQSMRFRPTLGGCVIQDAKMARSIEESYLEKLQAAAAYTYRSIMTKEVDCTVSALFEEIAEEEDEHFRLLGELILALGANPTVRTGIRVPPISGCDRKEETVRTLLQVIEEAIKEEKRKIDRLQILMGKTDDRVVRSLLDYLISDGHRHVEQLRYVMG